MVLALVEPVWCKRRVRRQGRGGIIVHSSASFDVYDDVRRMRSHMLWSGLLIWWETDSPVEVPWTLGALEVKMDEQLSLGDENNS